ncbi:MAG: CoA ester lyase [Alphaproteobacteria bacterium]|nr:MAG: CoA ester lyase [Alphaproteobacteria bacterium]
MTVKGVDEIRPRRSVLYMPGSNSRAMEKAKTLPTDAVILDLEDAVAPDAKEEARKAVTHAVKAGGYGGREIIIRVNSTETPWGEEDIKEAVKALPDAILVPKVSSAAEVGQLSDLMDKAGAPPAMKLWVMMETPLAILNAQEIAATAMDDDCRLSCFVMGTNDLIKETYSAQTADRAGLMTALNICVLAARAYGLTILDGVYNDIKNEEGFAAMCAQGAELGFDGKTLIHPSQLGPCNEVFGPSAEEVDWSRKVIAAFADPENKGKGVLKVEGRMTELLHRDIAERVVLIADAIARLEAETGA